MCDLLAVTGMAGRPASFYRSQSIPRWARRLNLSVTEPADEKESNRAYLAAVLRAGAGETGLFGLRLMWESVEGLSRRLDTLYPGLPDDAARFEKAFGPTLYVHLSRRDKVMQAVSLLKAVQTGLWHVAADGTERERTMPPQAPVYDADRLANQVTELEAQDSAWAVWFARQRIAPVRVTYESLSADPKAVMAHLLSALGLDPAIAATVEPKTSKMADGESLDWAARYRAETGRPPA